MANYIRGREFNKLSPWDARLRTVIHHIYSWDMVKCTHLEHAEEFMKIKSYLSSYKIILSYINTFKTEKNTTNIATI